MQRVMEAYIYPKCVRPWSDTKVICEHLDGLVGRRERRRGCRI
jgi:hypothetical protein